MKTNFNRFKVTLLVLLGMFIFSACEDELNVTPIDNQDIIAADIFDNEAAYKQVLAGIYANLSIIGTDGAFGDSNIQGLDAGTSQWGRVLLFMQTLPGDQMIWSYENDPGTREIQRTIWTAQNPIFLGMWGRTLTTIAFANNLLSETTDAKLDERNVSAATRTEIVTFRAEARLLRAMSYYYMMDLFGKSNFITEDTPAGTAPEVYNRRQLFDFVESELLAIESDLTDAGMNEHGRADKGVAWMILAKIYLNAEVYIQENRYADCLAYCERIIGGGYALATDYSHNFLADNDVNSASSEIIFPLISDGVSTQNFGPTTVMINGGVGSIEKNGDNLGVGEEGWGGGLRLRKQFVELFTGGSFSQDSRNTILSAGRPIEIFDISDRDQGYVLEKYRNRTSTGGYGLDREFVDTDFPLYRLADVYLMYAEAHLRGGGGSMGQALTYIQELRTRSNNPEVLTTGDITLDFILDERARELHWESHRRQDLIRYGRFTGGSYNWAWKGGGTSGIAIPNHFNLYPIPIRSLSSNPNLRQNTGY